MFVGLVDEVADDLRHVGDRRQLVRVEGLGQHRAGLRIVQPHLGERVTERLDDPALDLAAGAERVDHAADVVDRDDLSTTTSPVPTSTATSASWIPNVRTRMPAGFGPRAPLPRIWPASSRPVISDERPRAAVRADDLAALQRQQPLLALEALRRELDHLACGVCGRRAYRRAHRRKRRRAAGDGGVRAARRVAELDFDAVEREAELLCCDLRHRGPCAGPDVLHRRDDVHAPVRAEPDPRIARRAATAVPGLARHAHPALPDRVRPGAHLVAALPVRLGSPVALHQLLRGEGTAVHRVDLGVVELSQLQRVDSELGGELVEEAFE